MRLLETTEGLRIGDVVLVHQQGKDKATGKPYTWRWFGLVARLSLFDWIFSALELTRPERPDRRVVLRGPLGSRFGEVYHMDDDSEWPDGVWALRTRAILEGRVDII